MLVGRSFKNQDSKSHNAAPWGTVTLWFVLVDADLMCPTLAKLSLCSRHQKAASLLMRSI
jgi:hypothetical protein